MTRNNFDTDATYKVRENRLRRQARRDGLILERSRTRTPEAVQYGTYHLVDADTRTLAVYGLSSGYGLSLDEVESALAE